MQDSLPAGGLRLYREGVEPSGSLRKVSGYISILLSRTSPVARVVYAKPPFAGPEQVLEYVGRYTHRVAISNNRLRDIDDGNVRFTWKDYRHHDQIKVMTLSADEFIRRFLLHVLPAGFHRIRYYGLLGNRHRAEKLACCRRLLGMTLSEPAPRQEQQDYRARYEELTGNPLTQCPVCHEGRMIIIETLHGTATPPPVRDTS
jgi:Putative transposase